jgi:hypothetical protein
MFTQHLSGYLRGLLQRFTAVLRQIVFCIVSIVRKRNQTPGRYAAPVLTNINRVSKEGKLMSKEKKVHFIVESKIDGNWVPADFVFENKEQAEKFGEDSQVDGEVGEYRIRTTLKPVNLPEYIKDPAD